MKQKFIEDYKVLKTNYGSCDVIDSFLSKKDAIECARKHVNYFNERGIIVEKFQYLSINHYNTNNYYDHTCIWDSNFNN